MISFRLQKRSRYRFLLLVLAPVVLSACAQDKQISEPIGTGTVLPPLARIEFNPKHMPIAVGRIEVLAPVVGSTAHFEATQNISGSRVRRHHYKWGEDVLPSIAPLVAKMFDTEPGAERVANVTAKVIYANDLGIKERSCNQPWRVEAFFNLDIKIADGSETLLDKKYVGSGVTTDPACGVDQYFPSDDAMNSSLQRAFDALMQKLADDPIELPAPSKST